MTDRSREETWARYVIVISLGLFAFSGFFLVGQSAQEQAERPPPESETGVGDLDLTVQLPHARRVPALAPGRPRPQQPLPSTDLPPTLQEGPAASEQAPVETSDAPAPAVAPPTAVAPASAPAPAPAPAPQPAPEEESVVFFDD